LTLGLVAVAAACGPATYLKDARPFPAGCVDVGLAEVQCRVLVEAAREHLGIVDSTIKTVELLTEDRCGPTRETECRTGVGFVAGVRFVLADGSEQWTPVLECRPGAAELFCPVSPR
jgi:hypothetical protein